MLGKSPLVIRQIAFAILTAGFVIMLFVPACKPPLAAPTDTAMTVATLLPSPVFSLEPGVTEVTPPPLPPTMTPLPTISADNQSPYAAHKIVFQVATPVAERLRNPQLYPYADADWSPDGASLLFHDPAGVHILNRDGSGYRLLPGSLELITKIAWSSQGRITFLPAYGEVINLVPVPTQ